MTDYMGFPLDGYPVAAVFGEDFLDIKPLVDTALEVAEEKRKQAVFSFLFQRWLEETSEILGLGPSITDKLLERYPTECFDSIPKNFWPKDRKKRKDVEERVKSFERKLTDEIYKVLSPPEETTPGDLTLEEIDREETGKLNPEEANTDPKAFLERWQKAEEVALERWFRVLAERLAERSRKETQRFIQSYANVAWELRKKKIEEAKASLQKQSKR